MKTVKMRLDKDSENFLYKKDRRRDRLNSATPKEGLSDRQYENVILQCLPPEYDIIHQPHFKREGCNLEGIRRIMSKIYADNLTRSNSDSPRDIARRSIAVQATGRDLSNANATTATNSATIRTTVPSSRQFGSRISDTERQHKQ